MICQVQSMTRAREVVKAGADVIVAQGGEAGGHSGNRSTLTLVPEIADYLADVAPDTLLVAAGGIADGRGLAAALMLGADGILMGSRLVASSEAATPPGFLPAIFAADGDSTIKTTVIDIVRNYDWPDSEFKARALRNRFIDAWHGREGGLKETATNTVENERYWSAFHSGDADNTGLLMGEAVGLIHEMKSASQILADMVAQAEQHLKQGVRQIVGAKV
jgi:nitronate monooxygenase